MKSTLFTASLLTALLFFSSIKIPNQSSPVFKHQQTEVGTISIQSCETGTVYHYTKGKVELTYFKKQYLLEVSKNDSIVFENYIEELLQGPAQQLLMTMTDDGFSFKVSLNKGEKTKRILVSNAYDKQLDDLFLLFNTYFDRLNFYGFESNNIGYPDPHGDFDFMPIPATDTAYVNTFSAKKRSFLLNDYCN